MSRNLKMALLSVALMAGFGSGAVQAIPVDDLPETQVIDTENSVPLDITDTPNLDLTVDDAQKSAYATPAPDATIFSSGATMSVVGFIPDVLPTVELLVPRTITICACYVMVRFPVVMDFGSLASISSFNLQSTAVPEPDSLALFGLALPGLLAMRRSTRR